MTWNINSVVSCAWYEHYVVSKYFILSVALSTSAGSLLCLQYEYYIDYCRWHCTIFNETVHVCCLVEKEQQYLSIKICVCYWKQYLQSDHCSTKLFRYIFILGDWDFWTGAHFFKHWIAAFWIIQVYTFLLKHLQIITYKKSTRLYLYC